MKMPIVWHSLQVALLPLVAALPLAAMAQSAIQHPKKIAATQADIQFTFPEPVERIKPASDSPMFAFLPMEVPAVVPPVATTVMPLVALAATPTASLKMVKGKPINEQLLAYGKETGWSMDWQAPEYVLDKDMVIPGDFEAAVAFFLKGANEAGSRLRAVFYRGNKTVRVMEF